MTHADQIQLVNTHTFGYTESSRSDGLSVFVGATSTIPYIRRDGARTPHGRCGQFVWPCGNDSIIIYSGIQAINDVVI